MVDIIKAQGGKEITPEKIKIGKFNYNIKTHKKGIVKHISNNSISIIARRAGAPLSKGAGVYLYKHVNDKVKRGDKLFTIYSENKDKLKYAVDTAKEDSSSFVIKP